MLLRLEPGEGRLVSFELSFEIFCLRWDKIVLKKWYTIFKDHIALEDYEIHDGMNLELYYQ